jgi:hypothetical protein
LLYLKQDKGSFTACIYILREWQITMPQPRAKHLHELIETRMAILEELSEVAGEQLLPSGIVI